MFFRIRLPGIHLPSPLLFLRLMCIRSICFCVSMFLCVLASIYLLSACTGKESASQHKSKQADIEPVSVVVQELKTKDIKESADLVANVISRQAVDLHSRVSGNIERIPVKAGDRVGQNALILVIDARKQEQSVQSALSALQANQSGVDVAKQVLSSAKAEIQLKEANLELAKKQIERYSILFKEGAVAKESVDECDRNVKAAQSELEDAKAKIRQAEESLNKAKNLVEQSKAQLSEEKETLGYYSIKSPFSGIVGDLPVKVGDYVTPDTKLTTVSEMHPLEVNFSVPAEYASLVTHDMPVQLIGSEGQNYGNAKIFFVAPTVNKDSQTVMVKASYDNREDVLRPDQAITARLIYKNRPGITVPTSAVANIGGQDFVFVVEKNADGKMVARQKKIKLGRETGDSFSIEEGLKNGDSLVLTGVKMLSDGFPVKIGQ